MTIIKVAVNKQNQIKFKNRLKILITSHDVLEDKYEGLKKIIDSLLLHYQREYENLESALNESYELLKKTFITNGKQNIELIAPFCKSEINYDLKKYSKFGITLIDIIFPEDSNLKLSLDYGLVDTSPLLEKTRNALINTLKYLLVFAISNNVLFRIAREMRKTRKKISALENLFIPNYRETINYIQFVLEEKERYEMAIHKILKNKLGRE
ncbi:MAG: V-type ATP synthase subunit D [Candidatus Helarchaeota archaeon]